MQTRIKKIKLKVYLDKELKLTTHTTDEGEIYYITLIKKLLKKQFFLILI